MHGILNTEVSKDLLVRETDFHFLRVYSHTILI